MSQKRRLGVSLFTGGGIGDIGLRAAGIDYLVMTELDPPRADLAANNFPGAKVVTGDLWDVKEQVCELVEAALQSADEELFLLSCTAPCQGMSKSGRGTLLNNARAGKRPHLDERNRLILPALEVIKRLTPRWVVFENVSEMAGTVIEDASGELRPILDIIQDELSPSYDGRAYELEFADYGIPQRRKRLITVYSRDPAAKEFLERGGELVPTETHAARPVGTQLPWVPVSDVLKDFPPLDARTKDAARDVTIAFHRVPVLDEKKYEWVANAAPGTSAFDNQCSSCGCEENPTHGNSREGGINRSKKDTPMRCIQCKALLPRPHVLDEDGEPRIMSGFTSAYKRMRADLPAPALTRNLSYACSDQKVHPTQNRVLSLAEAFAVHTLSNYEYSWSTRRNLDAKDAVVRLVLGESIPPKLMELIGRHIVSVQEGTVAAPPITITLPRVEQLSLIDAM